MEDLMELAGSYTPLVINAVKALVVLVLGWMVAGLLGRTIRKRVHANPRIDDTLGSFAASVVKWVVLVIVAIAVLGLFGIQATSLVAILGAATLAIGLALQGTLSDLAAGFMLILFRPVRLGQYADIGGTAGTVTDINLFFTELTTPDNVQIIMPNGQVWGRVITNYSHHDTRRLDLTFGIDYADDPDRAIRIIRDLAAADPRVRDEPEPWVRLTNLGESSLDISAHLWCAASDHWGLKWDMLKAVKDAFDEAGITIPYPHVVEVRKPA